MRIIGAIIFAVLATAAAFSTPYWASAIDVSGAVSGGELPLAERLVADLRTRNYRDAVAITDPAFRPKDLAVFDKLSGLFPKRKENALRVSAWHKLVMGGNEQTQIEMFYDFDRDGAVRCQFNVVRTAGGPPLIQGANITRFSQRVLHGNDFRLPDTAVDLRWAYLAIGVLFDLFAFATFALCLVSPVVRWRWRWLWLLFVLGGVLRFNLDWSSLQFNFQAVAFLIPPAGFYQTFAYGPWLLSLTAPIGAALYWARLRQWRHEGGFDNDRRADATTPPSSPAGRS